MGQWPLDDVLAVCDDHRVTGEALAALRTKPRGREIEPLYAALLDQQTRAAGIAFRHQQTVTDLLDRAAELPPFIYFKGNAEFIESRQPIAIRQTSDIDLLFADASASKVAFERAGFENLKEHLPEHEFANIRINDVTVDCHTWIPVWAPERLDKDASPVPNSVVIRQMTFEQALPHCVVVPLTSGGEVLVPGATLRAFLSMCNLFRDWEQSNFPFSRVRVPLRLGDIFILRRALRNPEFDASVLRRLQETFAAQHLVHWAIGRLHAACPGDSGFLNDLLSGLGLGRGGALKTSVLHCHAFQRFDDEMLALDRHITAGDISRSLPPAGFGAENSSLARIDVTAAVTADEGTTMIHIKPRWQGEETKKRVLAYLGEDIVQFYFDPRSAPRHWAEVVDHVLDVVSLAPDHIAFSYAGPPGRFELAVVASEFSGMITEVEAAGAVAVPVVAV